MSIRCAPESRRPCSFTGNFSTGGGEKLAAEAGVPFLGRIPIDPEVARSGDDGDVFLAVAGKSPSALAFKGVIAHVLAALDNPPAAKG